MPFHQGGDIALPWVQTDAPLQDFAGSIVSRPGEGQHARYTHFNGLKCTKGGRMVEKKRGRCEGGFCRLKVGARPSPPQYAAALLNFNFQDYME